MKGSIDWVTVHEASLRGELHLVLQRIPPEVWGEMDPRISCAKLSLYVCSYRGNIKAAVMLMNQGLTLPWRQITRPFMMRMLLSQNRTLNQRVLRYNLSFIDSDDRHERESVAYDRLVKIVCVAIANGARLRGIPPKLRRCSVRWKGFQKGIIDCRSVVVALLKVKDAGKLHHWDRFLLKELALQVWVAREEWANRNFVF